MKPFCHIKVLEHAEYAIVLPHTLWNSVKHRQKVEQQNDPMERPKMF